MQHNPQSLYTKYFWTTLLIGFLVVSAAVSVVEGSETPVRTSEYEIVGPPQLPETISRPPLGMPGVGSTSVIDRAQEMRTTIEARQTELANRIDGKETAPIQTRNAREHIRADARTRLDTLVTRFEMRLNAAHARLTTIANRLSEHIRTIPPTENTREAQQLVEAARSLLADASVKIERFSATWDEVGSSFAPRTRFSEVREALIDSIGILTEAKKTLQEAARLLQEGRNTTSSGI